MISTWSISQWCWKWADICTLSYLFQGHRNSTLNNVHRIALFGYIVSHKVSGWCAQLILVANRGQPLLDAFARAILLVIPSKVGTSCSTVRISHGQHKMPWLSSAQPRGWQGGVDNGSDTTAAAQTLVQRLWWWTLADGLTYQDYTLNCLAILPLALLEKEDCFNL